MKKWTARFAWACMVGLGCCSVCLFAQDPNAETVDDILAGHSYHGDSFNEGPRQAAYLMGGTGNVRFPVTTASEEAQKFIHQGVGQLHGFWDLEAERSFRHAASLDPDCAMAYWGAALATLQHDKDRSRGFIKKALEKSEHITDREVDYIKALAAYLEVDEDEEVSDENEKNENAEDNENSDEDKEEKKDRGKDRQRRAEAYVRALESIALEYPDDLEAKAFVAHRIWQNAREGVKISSYLATDALLNEIFQQEPLHPAHHYCIHLWDYREPAKALASAARCGPAAPGIAHMWHMPGHIYSRLKRYEDAVYQQEASARVDHAHMMRDQVLPDEIHNFAHNNEWLIKNLVFVGRAHDAVALATNMVQLPCHPKYNTLEKSNGSASYGRRRLLQVLREFQLFDQAIELCQNGTLPETDSEQEKIKQIRILGCASSFVGNHAESEQAVWHLKSLLETWENEQAQAQSTIDDMDNRLDPGEGASPTDDDITDEQAREKRDEAKKVVRNVKRWIGDAEKAVKAIEGYQKFVEGDYLAAEELLNDAGEEDASWLGELKFLGGKREDGLEMIRKEIDRRPQEVIPLARLTFLLHQSGETDECRSVFERLRETSRSIDLDVPLFARLNPIALELGYEERWLADREVPADVGFRPPLDTLGPMRWSPPRAPRWQVANESDVNWKDYQGRAHLIIFYLGYECLHCAEQLSAFGPRYDDYADAGIEMIAISTDDEAGLKRSIANYDGHMPIPLHSDSELTIFKQFRAFDDFENQPLHGTFLISPDGRILWQDISYEPFMDHEFLLSESTRLLRLEYAGSFASTASSE